MSAEHSTPNSELSEEFHPPGDDKPQGAGEQTDLKLRIRHGLAVHVAHVLPAAADGDGLGGTQVGDVLGQLIGLARGLSGFSMGDSAAVQQSIVTLIPGMRFAFTTSIFGVVGSVLFTLITRAVYGSSEHTLKAFYGAMSRYAGVLSVDPMTQIAIYQQEQTALIQTMAKDLNGAFTENITAAESVMLKPERPCARPISVPRKPSEVISPGRASANEARPGPYITVSSLM